MKVLHVVEALKGGPETYLRDLIYIQQNKGYVVNCLLPSNVDWFHGEFLFDSGRDLKSLVMFASGFRKMIVSGGYDILHIHGTFAGVVCRLITFLSLVDVKIVYCSHGWSFDREDSFLRYFYMLAESLLSGLSDVNIAISEHDYLRGNGVIKNQVLVENAVYDMSLLHQVDNLPKRKRLLFVGRLDRQKGADILVEKYQNGDFDFELVIAGDNVLADCVIGSGGPSVRFTGWLDSGQLANEYARCTAVIVPSRWEGFGLVAVEAMSMSKMIFTTGAGGLKKLTEASGGVLFRLDEIESALELFGSMTFDELFRRGVIARKCYEDNYTLERFSLEMTQVYESCLSLD